jgi:hypothetical protein
MKIDAGFIKIVSIAYVGLVLLAAIGAFYLASPSAVAEIGTKNLEKAANTALTISNDLIKQLITLGTALIGFSLWLLKRPLTDARELVERCVWTAIAIILLAASLYFGFIALQRTLFMTSWGSFDPRLDLIWWPQFLQYYCFLGGTVVLGFSCVRSLNAILDTL